MIAGFDAIATGTDIQRRIGVKTSRDEPLARFTTMRVGGPADLFATAHNAHELRALVRFARTRELPHLILGRGSDLVIADAGVRGLVIQVRAEGSRTDGDRYTAEAGVQMARAATETQRAGLTGLEFGLAIPGTVGGAVWANAGAHDADVAGVLESARVLAADGTESIVAAADLGFAYRDSRFKARRRRRGREVVIDATFRLTPADPELIKERLDDIRHWRQAHQPLGPAVGRQRLPQPDRRFGRPAHRRGRAQGHADRRRRRLGEARELHRQRPEGDRDRRPAPGRAGPRHGPGPPRRRPSSSRSSSSATGRPSRRCPRERASRRSSSCSAGRRPSTTSRSCPGRRSPRP